ncbi:MAG: hypothetical protein HG465_003045 [Mogibacterium sp.]|jgi:hypothetical protein|uniref:hypothetical protein n=1 Tax=Mogibacterium sp. TaxID=2049035 RepID=UPI001795FDCA|nr:hypothetical protein [Mogibacterium sp.]MBB1533090.1 hypothetical protein [Mogibacterium sp.]
MNEKELIKSEDQFSFELKGDESIDAAELSLILQNTVNIVSSLVQGQEDTYVNLKVTKFSTGSFDIDFRAVCEQIKNLINCPESLSALIVAGVTGAFGLVKHLKGEKPKTIKNVGDNCVIENFEGKQYSVNKCLGDSFFKDSKIENSVINIVNIAENNKREGFFVKGDLEEVAFNEADYSKVGAVVPSMLEENNSIFTQKVDAILEIRKPDLVGNSKWGFIFTKNIEATIEDKEWLEKIHEEKTKFCVGMKLPVHMRIDVPLDENRIPVGEPTYTVLRITGDIIEEEDNQINFNL